MQWSIQQNVFVMRYRSVCFVTSANVFVYFRHSRAPMHGIQPSTLGLCLKSQVINPKNAGVVLNKKIFQTIFGEVGIPDLFSPIKIVN